MQAFNEKHCCNTSNALITFATEELSSSQLCYCFGPQASWVNDDTIWSMTDPRKALTQFLLWSGPGEDWTRIQICCWRLLLFQIQYLKTGSEVDVLTEKCCSQKHRWNSPRKSGSHCLWACAYVNKYVCLCACSCMHMNTHCFCVMGLMLIHSKSSVLLGFPNVEAFFYASWKLSVKNWKIVSLHN